jgi:hypothetical protein
MSALPCYRELRFVGFQAQIAPGGKWKIIPNLKAYAPTLTDVRAYALIFDEGAKP